MPAGPFTPSRYAVRGLAVLLSFLVASGPLRARAESNLFPDVYRDLENAAPPKVVVLAVSLDKEADKKLGLLEGITERAVDDSERFQLSPLAFALDPDATKARQQQQLKADQALKDGQKALEDLDAVKALKLADDAIAFAKAGEPATKRGFETYVQAAVMRAASMVANGDNAAAKTEIEKILVFAPKAAFPDSNFPPELIKHAETTRKKLAAATGTIVVRSEPPGARVHIDGTFRGYAPVTATGFASGNHLAVAQLGGYQTIAGEIPVDDQTVKLKPAEANSRLTLARDKVKKDPDGPGRDQAARDFGRLLSADQVVLVVGRAGLSPGKLELYAERIEVKDGHNDAFKSGSIEAAPEPLATFVNSVLQTDAPREGGKAVAHFGGSGGSSGGGGSGRFVLGLSMLGVAVIGLGSGIYCGLQASDRAAQYKRTPQVQTPTSASLASEGRTFSIIADISYAIALLAAAAGTFFLVTSRSKSSSSPPRAEEAPPPQKENKKAPPPQDAKETKKTEPPPPDDSKKKADEPKKTDDAAAKKKADDDAKKAEEEKPPPEKKMTEKERRAEEKRLKAEEKKRAEEERKEEKRRKEEEAKQAKEDKKKAEEQKKADEAAKKKADEEAAAAAKRKKSDEEDEAAVAAMKKKADEAAKKKGNDDASAAAAKKKADDDAAAKKKADDDAAAAAAKKKADEGGKKKTDDDAAAKKKADDDAAAKKKADDDAAAAAAKKKADDDAAAAAAKKKADDDGAGSKKPPDQSSGSKSGDDDKKKKEDQRRKQQQDDEDLKNQ